jgi:hypothetical protein
MELYIFSTCSYAKKIMHILPSWFTSIYHLNIFHFMSEVGDSGAPSSSQRKVLEMGIINKL